MNDAPINKFEASDPHRHPRDDEYRTKSSKPSDHESKALTLLGLATLNNIPIDNFVIE